VGKSSTHFRAEARENDTGWTKGEKTPARCGTRHNGRIRQSPELDQKESVGRRGQPHNEQMLAGNEKGGKALDGGRGPAGDSATGNCQQGGNSKRGEGRCIAE